MTDLRAEAIKLAATLPKGSTERKALLSVLAKTASATFHTYYEEVKNAFVSDVLGQATAILRASGATAFQEGLNVLTFMLGGGKGKIIFFWTGSQPGRLDASVHLVTEAGERRDGHNVFEVMDLDPREVALKALYLDAKDSKLVFPL